MTATAFDTLKAAKALKDAGFDEAQAEAVVATVEEAVRQHTAPLARGIATILEQTATREQVAAATNRMATKDQLAAATQDMATREHVAAEIAGLRAEMAVEFKALYRHLWMVGTGCVGVTVALVKLIP